MYELAFAMHRSLLSNFKSHFQGIEQKRQTLNEIIEYIANNNGVLFEAAYPESIKMVGVPTFIVITLRWRKRAPVRVV